MSYFYLDPEPIALCREHECDRLATQTVRWRDGRPVAAYCDDHADGALRSYERLGARLAREAPARKAAEVAKATAHDRLQQRLARARRG